MTTAPLEKPLLEGRPAIVTGAAGGIGRGHVLHLAAAALHLFLKLSLFTAQAPIYTDLRVIS